MTYQLGISAAQAFERLRPLATLGADVHINGEVYDSAGAITAAELTWIKAGNCRHRDWDNTTLGTLRLDRQRLVVEVNSARRRDRIAKEIAKRFGEAAIPVETTVTDLVKELEARRARGAGTGRRVRSPSPEPDRAPELEALEAGLARKHWEAWIDTRVPALGNRTPRQAAKTERGRERLAALLADFARTAERSPSGVGPDLEALRRRLAPVPGLLLFGETMGNEKLSRARILLAPASTCHTASDRRPWPGFSGTAHAAG